MTNKYLKIKKKVNPVYLYIEIDNEKCSSKEIKILKKYAGVKLGETIARIVVVPDDMPLGALHYTIQRLFGWINRYKSSFELPDDIFYDLTENNTSKWSNLVGLLFCYPWFEKKSDYANVNYKDNKKTFPEERFREEYTGPYYDNSFFNSYRSMQKFIQDYFSNLEVIRGLHETFNIDKLTSFSTGKPEQDEHFRLSAKSLLPSITVSSLMTQKGSDLCMNKEIMKVYAKEKLTVNNEYLGHKVLPFTNKLIYIYGAESKWKVNILRLENVDDLIKGKVIDETCVEEAKKVVIKKHKPYCIFKNGANVLDDVDNLPGFCEFLLNVFENDDIEKKKKTLRFGRRRDWHAEEIHDPILF